MHEMMTQTGMAGAGIAIVLAGSVSLILFRLLWILSNRRSAAPRRPITGRRATVYWHSPTGLQDERGLTDRPRDEAWT